MTPQWPITIEYFSFLCPYSDTDFCLKIVQLYKSAVVVLLLQVYSFAFQLKLSCDLYLDLLFEVLLDIEYLS